MQEKQTYNGLAGDVVRLLKLRNAAANSAPLRVRKPLNGVELPGNSHFLAALSSRKMPNASSDCAPTRLDEADAGTSLDIQLDIWNAASGWKEVR